MGEFIENLSFQSGFLLRLLTNIPNFTLKPVIRDGKWINLSLSRLVSGRKYTISFRDSLLMLPVSLSKLCQAFKVNNKTIFPYHFVNNKNISLEYKGVIPEMKYFNSVNEKEYLNYINNFTTNSWNLRSETIKYCEKDVISLYQVLTKFNTLIFNKYKLNIHRFPTLPSLAFAIFKSCYMPEKIIPRISTDIYNFIRSGYTGGHSDKYKPRIKDDKVYCYDVNSLYPTVLKNNDMPVGTPKYLEFNDFKNISEFFWYFDKPFGFFEVEVTTPKNLYRPLFQTRVKTKNGIRTIAPNGKWIDVIFSEEMFKYIQYGYNFKVIRGYLFDRQNIFKDYINDLYKIKESLNKDEPMYLVSKLLMNSLYGRFGMSNEMSNNLINGL